MKIIICGGRDMDRATSFNALERDLINELAHASGTFGGVVIDKVIHGGARGADEAALFWR
jgi:hypothetical protein